MCFCFASLWNKQSCHFQCVNAKPYNDPKDLLDPNFIQVTSVNQATECLINCKSNDFGIVMLTQMDPNDGLFECTCIKENFYEFAMQDLSSNCLVSIKNSSFCEKESMDSSTIENE